MPWLPCGPARIMSLSATKTSCARLNTVETDICLQQLTRLAKSEMRTEDSRITRKSLDSDRSEIAEEMGLGDANNARVTLFRAILTDHVQETSTKEIRESLFTRRTRREGVGRVRGEVFLRSSGL